MTNRIQQTYARTTSTGAGGAQPFLLETKGMTDHATLNADILAAAKEAMQVAIVSLRGLAARCRWAVAQNSADLRAHSFQLLDGHNFRAADVLYVPGAVKALARGVAFEGERQHQRQDEAEDRRDDER